MATEARWCMVSRRQAQSCIAAFLGDNPDSTGAIWACKSVCRWYAWPNYLPGLPFRKRCWSGWFQLLRLAINLLNITQVEMAFGPCAAYLVDVMHSRSAESLAANGYTVLQR